MEQYTLIGLGNAENVARLLRGEALDVTEGDHGTLVLRECGNRLLDHATRLAGEQPLLRNAPRRRDPVAVAREPVHVDRGVALVAVGREGGERSDPRLPLTAGLRLVRQD